MTHWALARDRRERLQKALQLLVASGVIRPASLELANFGAGGTVAAFTTWSNVSSSLWQSTSSCTLREMEESWTN